MRSDGQFLGDGPRQQFVDPIDRVLGDALEHVAQVGLEVEAVELRGAEQGVDRGGALAAVVGAGEQPVLATERDGAQRRSAALLSISRRPSSR